MNEFVQIHIRFLIGVCKPTWKPFDVSVLLPLGTDSLKPPGSCQSLQRALFSVHPVAVFDLYRVSREKCARLRENVS
jgi:hypothetical protein